MHYLARPEVTFLEVARNDHRRLDRVSHACQHIGQEEMAESDFAERCDQDVPQGECRQISEIQKLGPAVPYQPAAEIVNASHPVRFGQLP